MKGHAIVPIAQVGSRPPEAGRIRLGKREPTRSGNKVKPVALSTFRFTSPNQKLIEAIAREHGGTCRPWNEPTASPRNQFEVLTPASTIPIYVYPEGFSAWYEAWSGGGCLRRCDGIECEVPIDEGDDYRLDLVPCLCERDRVQLCQAKVRLQVILPGIPFAGVWRVETGSHNAHAELQSMMDIISFVQQRGGFVPAELTIEQRSQVKAGKTKHFVVPVVHLVHSLEELASGAVTSVAALAAAAPASGVATPALGSGQPDAAIASNEGADRSAPPADDEVVDAELVDDETLEIESALAADAQNFGLDGARYINAIRRQVGVTENLPTADQKVRMKNCSALVRAGQLTPLGFLSVQGVEAIDWQRSDG